VYFYFLIFNKFHLYYLEQTQLFRFSGDYFQSFTHKPGDLLFYLGEFVTQFFVNAPIAAFLITITTGLVCLITYSIFRRIGLTSLIIGILPAVLLTALQSNQVYKIGLTLGLALVLSFLYGYLLIGRKYFRYAYGVIVWVLLYYSCGALALFGSVLVILAEVFYFSEGKRWLTASLAIGVSILVPYIGVKFLFFEPFNDAWFYPLPFWGVNSAHLFGVLMVTLLVIYAGVLLFLRFSKKVSIEIPVGYKSIIAACIVVIGGAAFVKFKTYDPKTEIFLGMDHYVQTGEWNKVLKLSQKYQGINQLVLYYTNLALYESGQMGDKMFDYPQRGVKGLQLEWARDGISPFFGGEIFYHLNYINEANRWAFESMVAKGINPRSIKRLVLTGLINGEYKVVVKYLDLLDQTLYYADWAKKYREYVNDPVKVDQDNELAQKRHFLVKSDFISLNLGLTELLREHPDNRMAFEYLMSTFLLNKDINGFSENIYRLKELGYKEIPLKYEEALLFCMAYFKKDLVPEGFQIRTSTIQRKNEYIARISQSGGDRNLAARNLYPQFGNTAWFYLHFADQN
jgi:hypothetical protein